MTRLGSGLLALAVYGVHAVYHLRHQQPEHALWACHVASVLVGVGLLAASPTANAIGFLWLVIGVPLWLVDLCAGGAFLPTSLLTHVGGFVLAVHGLATLGMPRHAWWKAMLAFVALQQLTRVLTPPASNVNLAFAVWPGWEGWFAAYVSYEVVLVTAGLIDAEKDEVADQAPSGIVMGVPDHDEMGGAIHRHARVLVVQAELVAQVRRAGSDAGERAVHGAAEVVDAPPLECLRRGRLLGARMPEPEGDSGQREPRRRARRHLAVARTSTSRRQPAGVSS